MHYCVLVPISSSGAWSLLTSSLISFLYLNIYSSVLPYVPMHVNIDTVTSQEVLRITSSKGQAANTQLESFEQANLLAIMHLAIVSGTTTSF